MSPRYVALASLDALRYGARVTAAPIEPPLREVFAFIRRGNARVSRRLTVRSQRTSMRWALPGARLPPRYPTVRRATT